MHIYLWHLLRPSSMLYNYEFLLTQLTKAWLIFNVIMENMVFVLNCFI